MAFLNRFVDTIFLKESNSIEEQIQKLNSIKDKVVEKEQIARDIKLLEYGLYGEKELAFELKNANIGMYVLNDVLLKIDDYEAQIDYVIVTRGYVYLVECKNMLGDITVDNKGEFRREYSYGNKKIKEAIYSPYTQSQRHKDVLMKIWFKNNNFLSILLNKKAFERRYKTLIVLTNPKGLLNIKYAPSVIRNCTIRVDHLISYIKNDLQKFDKAYLYTEKQMLEVANSFINDNVKNYDYSKKYTFINDDNQNTDSNNDLLITKLKEFRKNKAKEKGIPAYYIFTDEELSSIIKMNIKTLDGLKNSHILSDTKIRFHGEEIISIINNL